MPNFAQLCDGRVGYASRTTHASKRFSYARPPPFATLRPRTVRAAIESPMYCKPWVLTFFFAAACASPVAPAASDALNSAESAASTLAIVTGATYAARCQSLAAAVCGRWEGCCDATSPKCVSDLNDFCMRPGKVAGLATAAIAGKLVLDPQIAAACDAKVAVTGAACGSSASSSLMPTCLFAWTDPAAIGQACVDDSGEVCGGGLGRCVAVTAGTPAVSQPTCVKAAAVGEPCPTYPAQCVWGAICGSEAGKPTCFAQGTLCGGFGDVLIPCDEGQICQDSVCVADPGVGAGHACAVAADCKRDLDCTAGKCVPKLCAKLP